MLLFTVFMWVTTVVVGMFSGKQWNLDHLVFCEEDSSLVATETTFTNNTPMQATRSPMEYSFRRSVRPRHELGRRGFTWVEIPPDHDLNANPNPDPVAASSRIPFGSVILRPNLPATTDPQTEGDMAVLRIVLEHQTLGEEHLITAAAERVTLLHPSTVPPTATMTRTAPTGITSRRIRSSVTSRRLRTSRTGRATPRRTGRTCRAAPRSHRRAARQMEGAVAMEGAMAMEGAVAMDVDEMDVQCGMWEMEEDCLAAYGYAAHGYSTYDDLNQEL